MSLELSTRPEVRLRPEASLHRAAFDAAPAGIGLIDAAGRVVEANPRLAGMIGCPADELLGLELLELTHPEDRPALARALARAIAGGRGEVKLDQRCLRRDGTPLWCSLEVFGVRAGRGRPAHVLALVEEIGRRRASREAMRRDAGRLAELVAVHERITDVALDLPAVRQLMLESVQRMTAAEAAVVCEVEGDELVWIAGSGAAATHTGVRLPTAGNLCGECVGTGRAVVCADASSDPRSDVSMSRRTGFRSVVYVPLANQGRVVGAVGAFAGPTAFFTAEDVTSLQLMAGLMASVMTQAREHHERKTARDRLAVIIESCPAAMFAYDLAGEITFMDGRGLESMGLEAGSWLGRPIFELFEARRRLVRGFRGTLRGREYSTTFVEGRTGRLFEARFSPVRTPAGEVAGGAGVVMDVTDRLEAEQARHDSDAKSRFLATVSHELRTPLNSVIGFSQLIAAGHGSGLNARQRRYVANIESSGQQLLTLINDLLDIGRIQAGRLDVALEDMELQALLRDVLAQMAPETGGRTHTIELRWGPPLWVRADRRRLHQVIRKLLSNALKFTAPGGIISLEALADADLPMVVVSDTGIGIPPDQLERVFDEFTQVESGMTRNQEGTGLGLALSRRLVELMGGSIGVASEMGCGSVFTISLAPSLRPGL